MCVCVYVCDFASLLLEKESFLESYFHLILNKTHTQRFQNNFNLKILFIVVFFSPYNLKV